MNHKEAIQNFLKHQNMSQKDFAQLCLISKTTVSLYLNRDPHKYPIHARVAYRICRKTRGKIRFEDLTKKVYKGMRTTEDVFARKRKD